MTATEPRTYASLRRATPQDRARAMTHGQEWFRIVNRADGRGTSFAEVYVYDEIGYYGVTAGQFVAELSELDVDEIDLHLNSPGGEVWDGIAIYNALVTHRAKVTAICEGIAASAASVIYMAGDDRVMAQGSQLMIHDAWGVCVGNATDMAGMAERLGQESDNIAGFYAARSGGSVAHWRKAMLAETWYSADEAVAVGLADRVHKGKGAAAESAKDRWDLKVFGYRYTGREAAPAPAPLDGVHRDPPPPIVRPAVAAAPASPSAGVAPAAPAAPPADPGPDTPAEPDEADLALAEAIGSVFGSAVAEATLPEADIDPDMFKAVVAHEANNRPAIPGTAPAVAGPSAAELAAGDILTNALMEALL